MNNDNLKTIKWLNRILGKKLFLLLFIVVIEVSLSVIAVEYAFLFRDIIDSAISKNTDVLMKSIIFIVGLLILQVSFQALSRYCSEKGRTEIENKLKSYFYNSLLAKEYAFISDNHSGQWMIRITSDTQIIANEAVACIPGMASMFTRIVFIVVGIIMIDHKVSLVIIPGGVALFILSTVFRSRIKELSKRIQEANGTLRSFLQEQLDNVLVVKSYGTEIQSGEKAAELMRDHKDARMNRTKFSTIARIGFSFAMNGAYILAGIYCGYRLLNNSISYGTVTAMLQLVSQIQSPFANISGYIPRFYSMLASAERLMEIENIPSEDVSDSLSVSDANDFYNNDLQSFGFRDMSFSYLNDGDNKVINNCNIEICKGDFVAVTGESGCGKSTLLKLMMSLYDVKNGEKYIRTNAEEIQLTAKYRKLFAYVPQSNQLMSGQIIEAVEFNSEHDDNLLRQALYLSNSDRFISEIPDGVKFVLKEHGSGLSEGQLQRLSIARAVYSKRPVLLLDEATSALDQTTRDELLKRIKTMTNMTVIMVTHNNDTLDYFDKVIHCEERDGEVSWTIR